MLRKLPQGERNERVFKVWQLVLLIVAYVLTGAITAAIALPQGVFGWLSWSAGLLPSSPLTPLFHLLKMFFQMSAQL